MLKEAFDASFFMFLIALAIKLTGNTKPSAENYSVLMIYISSDLKNYLWSFQP